MQFPADVDRKLLCFRAGKEHAMAQGMEKAPIAGPPVFGASAELLLSARQILSGTENDLGAAGKGRR
jgi:hypothetical protein